MRLAPALIASALLSTAAYADVAPPPREDAQGTWYGTMHQFDSAETYPMTLLLDERGGATEYPKLKCAGELRRVGKASGGYVIYKETITRGALADGKETGCVDGVVIIHSEGDQLVLGWFGAFDGEPVMASARLTRSQFNSNPK